MDLVNTMYILNWNPNERQVEASFGGVLTRAEADVFMSDLHELLHSEGPNDFEFVVDFGKVSRMDDGVQSVFVLAGELAHNAGASLVTFVTRDEDESVGWTNDRLQHVLEGDERVVAYERAA